MSFMKLISKVMRIIYEVVLSYLCFKGVASMFDRIYVPPTAVIAAAILITLTYISREKLRKNWQLVVVGIVLSGLQVLYPIWPVYRVVLVLIGLAEIISTRFYVMRNRTDLKFTDLILVPVILIIYLYAIGFMYHIPALVHDVSSAALLFALVVFVGHYFDGMYEYVTCTKGLSKKKMDSMLFVNTVIIFVLAAIMTAVIWTNNSFGIDKLVYYIGIFTRFIILLGMKISYYVMAFISWLFGFDKEPNEAPFQLELERDVEESGSLFVIIVTILATIVIVKFGIMFVKYLLGMKNEDDDAAEDETERVTEKEKLKREKKEPKRLFKTNSDKVRKIYRQRVYKYHKDITLDKYKTCDEIKANIYEETSDDIADLTEIYEQVRYGDKEITPELVKKAKSCKG